MSVYSIYLASRFSRQTEMCAYAYQLEELGFTITSRWLSENAEGSYETLTDTEKALYSMHDENDVLMADLLICFTPPGRNGGMHTELGIARGAGKKVIIVGPRTQIFHYTPGIKHFKDWKSALAYIDTL